MKHTAGRTAWLTAILKFVFCCPLADECFPHPCPHSTPNFLIFFFLFFFTFNFFYSGQGKYYKPGKEIKVGTKRQGAVSLTKTCIVNE